MLEFLVASHIYSCVDLRLRHGDEKNERRVYTGTGESVSQNELQNELGTAASHKTNCELRRLTKRTAASHKTNLSR